MEQLYIFGGGAIIGSLIGPFGVLSVMAIAFLVTRIDPDELTRIMNSGDDDGVRVKLSRIFNVKKTK